MEPERITCFVDGFNLYHALKELKKPHLKWLNLSLLFSRLTRSKSQIITQILFFSAYPTWKKDSDHRHRIYIKALSSHGVTPVLGQFKNKPKKCLKCNAKWISHEEKETDVNLALALLDLAYKNAYDHAFLLTRDSDLAPAVRKVKQNFPPKKYQFFLLTTIAIVQNYYKLVMAIKQSNTNIFPHLYSLKKYMMLEEILSFVALQNILHRLN
jgi:uncharacterized LabA/DUF88 family protein